MYYIPNIPVTKVVYESDCTVREIWVSDNDGGEFQLNDISEEMFEGFKNNCIWSKNTNNKKAELQQKITDSYKFLNTEYENLSTLFLMLNKRLETNDKLFTAKDSTIINAIGLASGPYGIFVKVLSTLTEKFASTFQEVAAQIKPKIDLLREQEDLYTKFQKEYFELFGTYYLPDFYGSGAEGLNVEKYNGKTDAILKEWNAIFLKKFNLDFSPITGKIITSNTTAGMVPTIRITDTPETPTNPNNNTEKESSNVYLYLLILLITILLMLKRQ